MKCLLVGNYGTGNLGDEALRDYFLLRFPEVEWTVLSANPTQRGEVPRLPFGFRSLLCTSWWKTLRAFWFTDAVVFGGGSLFTDSESVMACVLWWWHGLVARLLGKPLILAFQGIGPFRTRVGEWCARKTITAAAFVSVRDEESLSRASSFAPAGASEDKRVRADVHLSFDPVLILFPRSSEVHPGGEDILAVIPRMNSGEALRIAIQTFLERHRPLVVHILSMQPDLLEEQRMCDELQRMIGPSASVHPVRTLQELIDGLLRSSFVISERYHGALAAIALGVTVEIIAQAGGDKLDVLRTALMNPAALEALRERVRTGEEELRKYINML